MGEVDETPHESIRANLLDVSPGDQFYHLGKQGELAQQFLRDV